MGEGRSLRYCGRRVESWLRTGVSVGKGAGSPALAREIKPC